MKMHQVTVFGAAVLLALTTGCKREEPKPTAPPPPTPQTAPSPTPAPTPQPGTATAPGEPGRTVGQTVSDATINTKVKAALLQAPDVKGTDINVDTVNGTVTLKGSVGSQAQIDRAVTIAKAVEGVKQVENTLAVKSAK
jgi:hyperosmotically inducible protein